MQLHQKPPQSSLEIMTACIVECEHCAQSCMNEQMIDCARLCLDCAEFCRTAVTYILRESRLISQLARSGSAITEACAEECQKHNNEHCQKCARACREAMQEFSRISGVAGGV
jgi:hypothetical protein